MSILTMGKKIGFGFLLLLLLTVLMGYVSTTEMRQAAYDSDRIAREYVPKVTLAMRLAWSLNEALTLVRALPPDADAATAGAVSRALETVQSDFEKMRELSIRYPSHTPLAVFVKAFPSAYAAFVEATRQSIRNNEQMESALRRMRADAAAALSSLTSLQDLLRETAGEFITAGAMENALMYAENQRTAAVLYATLRDIDAQVLSAVRSNNLDSFHKAQTLFRDTFKQAGELRNHLLKATCVAAFEQTWTAMTTFMQAAENFFALKQTASATLTERHNNATTLLRLVYDIGNTGIRITESIVDSNRDALQQAARNNMILLLAILISGGVFAVVLIRMITKPLRITANFAQAVAAGDLDRTLEVHSPDETGQLADALRSMVASLRERLAEVTAQTEAARRKGEEATQALEEAQAAREAADHARQDGMQTAATRMEGVATTVSTVSDVLSKHIEHSSAGAEQASANMAETSSAMEEMNATVMEVARNASDAAGFSENMRLKAHNGAQVVGEAVVGIGKAREQGVVLKQAMEILGKQADGISRIMTTISDIADQTNLLALNAAIEAARAGDAGRGFAVVADEVRKLAEKTVVATTEVGQAVRDIQQVTGENIQHVEETVKAIEGISALADSSGKALTEIVSMAEEASDKVRTIATAAEEQSAASEEINRTISRVSEISDEVSASMHASMQSVRELSHQSEILRGIVAALKH